MTRHHFTAAQIAWLGDRYRFMSRRQIAHVFNAVFGLDLKPSQVLAALKNHGLRSGRDGRFTRGNPSWNAGTQGVMRRNAGSFAKGDAPPNRKPIGSERICAKDGYVYIKVAERDPYTRFPTRYRQKHVWVWEQAHGPVPKGHVLLFVDGDKTHCALSNLRCISRRELCWLNKQGFSDLPAEARDSAIALARLRLKTVDRAKGRREPPGKACEGEAESEAPTRDPRTPDLFEALS